MTENKIHDMVELYWKHHDGRTMLSVWPRQTAEVFLRKHLIPQKEQGLLADVGIRELECLEAIV